MEECCFTLAVKLVYTVSCTLFKAFEKRDFLSFPAAGADEPTRS